LRRRLTGCDHILSIAARRLLDDSLSFQIPAPPAPCFVIRPLSWATAGRYGRAISRKSNHASLVYNPDVGRALVILIGVGIVVVVAMQPKIAAYVLLSPGLLFTPLLLVLPSSAFDGIGQRFLPLAPGGGESFVGIVVIGAVVWWLTLSTWILRRR